MESELLPLPCQFCGALPDVILVPSLNAYEVCCIEQDCGNRFVARGERDAAVAAWNSLPRGL